MQVVLDELQKHFTNCVQVGSSQTCMLHVQVVEARYLKSADPNGLSDPYVKVKIDGAIEAKLKTPIYNETLNPIYNTKQSFTMKDSKLNGHILIEALDYDAANSNDSLGFCSISLESVRKTGFISGWFNLYKKKNMLHRNPGKVYLRVIADKNRSNMLDSPKFDVIRNALFHMVARGESAALSECTEKQTQSHGVLDQPVLPSQPPLITNVQEVPETKPVFSSKPTQPRTVEYNISGFIPVFRRPHGMLFSPFVSPMLPPVATKHGLAYKLSVACCSWNVGNAPPSDPSFLSAWLPQTDIVAIGTQENNYTPRKGFKNHIADFQATAQIALGDDYSLVTMQNMGQIVLYVFARAHVAPLIDIHETEKASEATGIANVGTNKGGCAVALDVLGTSIVFINAHLAAHTPMVERRNADVHDILDNLKFKEQSSGLSVLSLYDHVFFMGDLNYRLLLAGDSKEPEAEAFSQTVDMVQAHEYEKLLETDQLLQQMREEKVFCGFTDAPPMFQPSFKVLRDVVGPQYTDKRTPSYCDRVLWNSLPSTRDNIQLESFKCVPVVTSSDHKPVVAEFSVAVPAPVASIGGCYEFDYIRLVQASAAASDLPAANSNGLSDPFLKISSYMVNKSKSMLSRTINNTLNPSWAATQLPAIPLEVTNVERLDTVNIPLAVWDEDATKKSGLSSTCLDLRSINIYNVLCDAPALEDYATHPLHVELPLRTRGNLPGGRLQLTLAVHCKKGQSLALNDLIQMSEY